MIGTLLIRVPVTMRHRALHHSESWLLVFDLEPLSSYGVSSMALEARTDLAMLLGALRRRSLDL